MYCKASFFLLLTSAMLMSACSKDGSHIKPDSASSPVEQAAVEKQNMNQHKTHRTKPGANVSLQDNLVHRLEPGIDAEILVALAASYNEGDMMVHLHTSDGLLLVAGATQYTFSLREDGSYVMPLRLVAHEPGRYYVHLQVSIIHDGRQSARALSAIVQVGDEAKGMGVAQEKQKHVDDVIQLPADETIIQQ